MAGEKCWELLFEKMLYSTDSQPLVNRSHVVSKILRSELQGSFFLRGEKNHLLSSILLSKCYLSTIREGEEWTFFNASCRHSSLQAFPHSCPLWQPTREYFLGRYSFTDHQKRWKYWMLQLWEGCSPSSLGEPTAHSWHCMWSTTIPIFASVVC